MTVQRLVVDIATGTTTYEDMTPAETADIQATCAEAAQVRAAQEARVADQVAAKTELKAKAKTNPDLAVVCRALGIDPNAPGPNNAPGG